MHFHMNNLIHQKWCEISLYLGYWKSSPLAAARRCPGLTSGAGACAAPSTRI